MKVINNILPSISINTSSQPYINKKVIKYNYYFVEIGDLVEVEKEYIVNALFTGGRDISSHILDMFVLNNVSAFERHSCHELIHTITSCKNVMLDHNFPYTYVVLLSSKEYAEMRSAIVEKAL